MGLEHVYSDQSQLSLFRPTTVHNKQSTNNDDAAIQTSVCFQLLSSKYDAYVAPLYIFADQNILQ